MFSVVTDHPVAVDSRDHRLVWGTANDNSRWHPFNEKLYALWPKNTLSILDIGCAGGGFVKDCIDDGHKAVGLEGSDYSLLRKRAEWATIPDNLFTCDVTKPFTVLEDGRPAKFHAVTAWEVMEHIPEDGLPTLFHNVLAHLRPGGLWVMSVSTWDEFWHVTVHGRRWWEDLFQIAGFRLRPDLLSYFGNDWVRGPEQAASHSFHVVLEAP